MAEDISYPEEIKAANDKRLVNKVKINKYKHEDAELPIDGVTTPGFFSDKCEIKWPKKDKE